MTFAGDALALANRALDLWVSVHGSESLDQQCQRFSGYYTQWAYQGNESGIIGYASADAARAASSLNTGPINGAPVLSFIFWGIGKYGHVAQVIGYDGGRALIAHTSASGDTVLTLRNHVKVSHADSYPGTYKGWSYTNGRNPRMTGVTGWSTSSPSNLPADQVRRIAAFINQHAANLGLPVTNANVDGVAGARYWKLVQALGKAWGFYKGAVDGKPGSLTYAAEAHIWSTYVAAVPPPAPEPEKPADPAPEPETPVVPEPEVPTDPEPEQPADPDPEQEEPVAETPEIEVPVKVKLTDEKLTQLITTAKPAEPNLPIIADKPAKLLWVVLSLVAVSAGPVVVLTVLDWSSWDAEVGQQFASTVTAWAGSIGVVLGLSRFAKTK